MAGSVIYLMDVCNRKDDAVIHNIQNYDIEISAEVPVDYSTYLVVPLCVQLFSHEFFHPDKRFCFFLLSTSLGKAVMPAIGFQDLPLNIYVVVFGTGVFAFILSLIFCCYLIRLRRQAQSELYGYKEVILKGNAKKLSLQEQTCAVCLEDFKEKDELAVCPCKHAFHRKCLVKWLEIRNSCPMCNKAVAQHVEQTPVNAVTQGEELV